MRFRDPHFINFHNFSSKVFHIIWVGYRSNAGIPMLESVKCGLSAGKGPTLYGVSIVFNPLVCEVVRQSCAGIPTLEMCGLYATLGLFFNLMLPGLGKSAGGVLLDEPH